MKKSFLLTIVVVMAFIASCASAGGGGGGGGAAPAGKPPANPTTVIKLAGKNAKLETTGQLVYEEGPDRDNIGWWTKTDDKISWDLEIKEAGTYWILARLACDTQFPGSKVNVTINNQTFTFRVPDTETWSNWTNVEVGSVELKPGTYPIVVQAVTVANRFVANLNSLIVEK